MIMEHIRKPEKKHMEHIAVYGQGYERRLTGHYKTSPIDKVSYGVADRGASIRIPRTDCRPAANMDLYNVTARLVQATILDDA